VLGFTPTLGQSGVATKNVTHGIIWIFKNMLPNNFFSTIQLKQLYFAMWWPKIMPHDNLRLPYNHLRLI
jgi:hypothetical protein